MNLQAYDLKIIFLITFFFSNDCSQNMFFYRTTHNILGLRKDVFQSWKSKVIYSFKLMPMCTVFLNIIKLSENRIK